MKKIPHNEINSAGIPYHFCMAPTSVSYACGVAIFDDYKFCPRHRKIIAKPKRERKKKWAGQSQWAKEVGHWKRKAG